LAAPPASANGNTLIRLLGGLISCVSARHGGPQSGGSGRFQLRCRKHRPARRNAGVGRKTNGLAGEKTGENLAAARSFLLCLQTDAMLGTLPSSCGGPLAFFAAGMGGGGAGPLHPTRCERPEPIERGEVENNHGPERREAARRISQRLRNESGMLSFMPNSVETWAPRVIPGSSASRRGDDQAGFVGTGAKAAPMGRRDRAGHGCSQATWAKSWRATILPVTRILEGGLCRNTAGGCGEECPA